MELDAPAEYQDLESPAGAYHSVSALAIIALVAGLLSPLAFAHELLWSLPLTAIALSIVAIVRIDRSEGQLVGRWAAVLGLVISLFCVAGAITHATTRRLWLAYRAERMAERFIELLREGKPREAHQLWTRPVYQMAPGSDLAELYKANDALAKEYEGFLEREVIRNLRSLTAEAEIDHVRTRLTFSDYYRDYLMVFYRLHGPTKTGEIDKEVKFVIEHAKTEDGQQQWRVYSDEPVVE
jgi:hypothetical protein